MRYLVVAAALAATPALADCPPVPDRSAELAALETRIQAAEDERSARVISDQMWAIWATAPDAEAQEMLDAGMARREVYDFEGAAAAFDALVAYCPDYAEGYNQRAFVNFLRQDYGLALDDLERALERNPDHIAAMSGLALTLMGLGRNEAAQGVLRDAVNRNPWLPERHLLQTPPGEDL